MHKLLPNLTNLYGPKAIYSYELNIRDPKPEIIFNNEVTIQNIPLEVTLLANNNRGKNFKVATITLSMQYSFNLGFKDWKINAQLLSSQKLDVALNTKVNLGKDNAMIIDELIKYIE